MLKYLRCSLKSFLWENEEVLGVRVLYQALKESPMDYVMLDARPSSS